MHSYLKAMRDKLAALRSDGVYETCFKEISADSEEEEVTEPEVSLCGNHIVDPGLAIKNHAVFFVKVGISLSFRSQEGLLTERLRTNYY